MAAASPMAEKPGRSPVQSNPSLEQRSATELLEKAISDGSELIRVEVALAKEELSVRAKAARVAVIGVVRAHAAAGGEVPPASRAPAPRRATRGRRRRHPPHISVPFRLPGAPPPAPRAPDPETPRDPRGREHF